MRWNTAEILSVLKVPSLRSHIVLNLSFFVSMGFALLKLVMGAWLRSYWLTAVGAYYAGLAVVQFFLLRSFHHQNAKKQNRVFLWTAVLLSVLTVTMAGVFIQMVRDDRTYSYPGLLIYIMALWAFAKMITAVWNLVRIRRDMEIVLTAVRCVSFATALMSVQSLQTAMLSTFGGPGQFARMMNAVLGGCITLCMTLLSAGMLIHGIRAGDT